MKNENFEIEKNENFSISKILKIFIQNCMKNEKFEIEKISKKFRSEKFRSEIFFQVQVVLTFFVFYKNVWSKKIKLFFWREGHSESTFRMKYSIFRYDNRENNNCADTLFLHLSLPEIGDYTKPEIFDNKKIQNRFESL